MSATPPHLKALVAKLHGRLIPMLLLMYIMSFLNRTNLSFAKPAFQADTGISDAAFAFAAGIFFVGYSLFEIPSNLMLHRVGARIWLSRIMVSWGLMAAATAFVHTETMFYAVRILLGVAEAGFFPGVILFMTYWYPPQVRASAMGLFYLGPSLASILGGPFSGALLLMDGMLGLQGWQWMFLVQGLLASAIGVLAYVRLDNGPAEATWLNADDKALIAKELAGQPLDSHGARNLWGAVTNAKVLLLLAIYFLLQMGVYGFAFFLPTQVATLLHTSVGLEVGFITSLPWIAALAGVYFLPRLSDRIGHARGIAAGAMGLGGLGLAASVMLASPLLALTALCVACWGMLAVQPIFWTLPSYVLHGAAVAGGLALINSVGTFGAFFAPNLRVAADSWTGVEGAGVIALGVLVMIGAALILAVRVPKKV